MGKPYIHQLQDELSETKAEIEGLREGLRYLKTYLLSDKFYKEEWVSCKDVLARLSITEDIAIEYMQNKSDENHLNRTVKT
jgi:hypothetical protein